ncbi:hypothetical protein QYS49_35305 [Marivirga salinae]|uniref:Uncharacterized protein n=1 Tax=Marivirga salinarum TaxID=3059078 RepID=A0AA51ND90_9BACT|nr:hypothetical protein [Marivirga sp. BDSF4-3]WMN13010.1 hypothetical protein QYS49_35305 [Marivirga sp. BDSF4-3]
MSQKLEKNITKVFHGALLVSFLTIAIPIVFALITNYNQPTVIIWYIGYANLFVLWPLIIISLIGSVILHFKYHGLSRGTEKSSVRVLSAILAVAIVYLGTNELKFQNNQLDVTFKNNSSEIIKHIRLFGRGALTELDSLAPFSDTTVIFRGKSILRKIDNDYENEVTLLYYTDSTHFRQPILQGFGRWRVFNGPFQLNFYGPDSVELNYLKK